jgi:hypothetical protein
MSAKLKARQAAQLPVRTQGRIVRRLGTQAAGVHADQNHRRGARNARGGRNGERVQIRKEGWA